MTIHYNRGIAAPIVIIILLLAVGAGGWTLYFQSQQALSEMESVNSALKSAKSNLASEKRKNADLQDTVSSLTASQSSISSKLDVQSDWIEALEAKVAEGEKLQAALDKAYASISSLTTERDDAKQQIEQFAGERDDMNQLVSNLTEERDEARASDQRGREQLAELVAQMESSKQNSETYRSQLDAARAELSSTSEEAESLSQRIAALEAEREQERQAFAALQKKLDKELGEKRVNIEQTDGQPILIRLQDDVLFNSGSAELLDSARRALDSIGDVLKNYPDRSIQVEGHTDNVPISNGAGYPTNWELSAARASAAVRYLIKQSDIAPKRLRVAGHGKYNPIADNATSQGRARNRRIEITLLPAGGLLEVTAQ